MTSKPTPVNENIGPQSSGPDAKRLAQTGRGETAKRGYHHGDLRSALLQAGLTHLETQEADALSLRDLAREIGVSAPAIYRHFPNKDSLLRALAAEGLKMLAAEQTAAAGQGGPAALAASGQAYVRFAMRHPFLFRLIFSAIPVDANPFEASPEGSSAALLRDAVESLAPPHASEAERFAGALRAWALIHGLAMLILDRQIDAAIAEEMIEQVIRVGSIRLG
ncbi:MAG: TetR/AcrR family transcriptional regulator [Pseudomonadota bacterium]